VGDSVRQGRVTTHLLMESGISGDDRVLLLNGEREIGAVVVRMVEINGQPGRRRGELTHGEGDAYRCRSECIGSIGKILRTDFTTSMHGP